MPGLARIDVKCHRHLWPGALDRGKVDDIPRLAATFRPPQGDIRYARRMAGRGHGRIPAIGLPFINITNLRRQIAIHAADEQHVTLSTIAGVVQCRCCQPVKRFPARVGTPWRWDKLVYRRRSAGRRYGPGCAWVKDGVNLSSGRTPSSARLAISAPPTPLARRCRYPPAACSRVRGSGKAPILDGLRRG